MSLVRFTPPSGRPNVVTPAIELAVQSALLLVPETERGPFQRDLEALVAALIAGRDGDAGAIVERYVMGANFGAVLLSYRRRQVREASADGGQ